MQTRKANLCMGGKNLTYLRNGLGGNIEVGMARGWRQGLGAAGRGEEVGR